ncbi:MAG: hypothetical protein IPK17_22295 [Chloroflexi bacterium]|uniref:hypothetical protein n=1 Tax=Candidatus Flexifilum breve TaxID=3140694 RepID=UPI003134B333|nr:hypothetical protein [Chloroflexota bacterium]
MGDGELRPTLEAAVHAEPRIDARFVGFKNQSGLSPYYHAADLLVLPRAAAAKRGAWWSTRRCITACRVSFRIASAVRPT